MSILAYLCACGVFHYNPEERFCNLCECRHDAKFAHVCYSIHDIRYRLFFHYKSLWHLSDLVKEKNYFILGQKEDHIYKKQVSALYVLKELYLIVQEVFNNPFLKDQQEKHIDYFIFLMNVISRYTIEELKVIQSSIKLSKEITWRSELRIGERWKGWHKI